MSKSQISDVETDVTSPAFLLFYSGVLTRLKIVCLENEKREAKKKYIDSQKMYVKEMLGRPMEKLNVRIYRQALKMK